MPTQLFSDDMFTATKCEPASAKTRFANQFAAFVSSDFKRQKFPQWFYKRLSCTFGNIAHYNQDGFYQTWFTSRQKQVEFICNTLQYPCYGDTDCTYSDAEKAIQAWLKEYCIYVLNITPDMLNLRTARLTA